MQILFKVTFFVACLFFSSQNVIAQINRSRNFIVNEFGNNFTNGATKDGTRYIKYVTTEQNSRIGSYTEVSIFYFMTSIEKEEICFMRRIYNPSSLANEWLSNLNSMYVEVEKNLWKDYKTGMLFNLVVDDVLCEIEVKADTR